MFRYFPNHNRFALFEKEHKICFHCKILKKCVIPKYRNYNDFESGICLECLSMGVLREYGLIMNREYECVSPDSDCVAEMREYNPGLSDKELGELYLERCNMIAFSTPRLIGWQGSIGFPFIEGDFAQFLGFASKEDYLELAKGEDVLDFYEESLSDFVDEDLLEKLWEGLPDKKVQSFEEGNRLIVTSYLFKSMNSDKIFTEFDMA